MFFKKAKYVQFLFSSGLKSIEALLLDTYGIWYVVLKPNKW